MEQVSEERVVLGLRIEVIEEKYDAEYVGCYSIPGTGDGPFLVFYRKELNEKEIMLGYDNYFAIWRNPMNVEDIRILGGKKIRDASFPAIEYAPGQFICSRTVHDFVRAPNGKGWLDGGPFYTRCDPNYRPTHTMRVVDGKEVFTSVATDRRETDEDVIDAEFTSVHPGYPSNGMTALLADVIAFHTAVDQPVRTIPALPSQDEIDFRIRLIDEEYNVEFKEACARGDIVAAADALGDIIYVVLGTALHYGLASTLDRCWHEIQTSNMAKVDPVTGKVRKRPDGKVLKPEGWQPPNIERALGLMD